MVLWNPFRRRKLVEAGERFRREHSAWLTAAMSPGAPNRAGRRVPRIPTRRADKGGFDALRHRPGGMERAGSWWSAAFARVDEGSG